MPGWHLVELVNEILDLAQIESNKLSMTLEPMSLTYVVCECRAMIDPLAQARNIRVTFPDDALAYFVMADRTRVRQVLVNLLSNAIKYNRVGGAVELDYTATPASRCRAPPVAVAGLHAAQQLRTVLYVEDNPANLVRVDEVVARMPHFSMLSATDGERGIVVARASLPDVIPRDIERALKAGFFRYLTKPVKIGEFTDALDEALKFLDAQSASSLRAICAGSCEPAVANPGDGLEQGSLF